LSAEIPWRRRRRSWLTISTKDVNGYPKPNG
jgi:hypothetical protein